jgi:hypothetical protein
MICNVPGSLCVLRIGEDHSKKDSVLSIDTATSLNASQVGISSTMVFSVSGLVTLFTEILSFRH